MPFYHPQWNEHDKPTVRCPHVEGRRIGDDYCQHVCPHLTRVIDRQYETIIDCGYTVRRSHTPDTGGCRFQTTIATPAESAPAPTDEKALRDSVLALVGCLSVFIGPELTKTTDKPKTYWQEQSWATIREARALLAHEAPKDGSAKEEGR